MFPNLSLRLILVLSATDCISYHKDTRVETYPYAREAIREAFFNALCHSDWGAGVPIQIRIDSDKMFISNCCVFPENWTKETLMQEHESVPYNPDIAKVFYRAGFIEAWGRGIKKICDACHNLGANNPDFIIRGKDVMVKFEAFNSRTYLQAQNNALNDALNDALEIKVLKILKLYPATTQLELATMLNVSRPTIQRTIKFLVENDRLKRDGSRKNGKWIVLSN